MSNKLEDLGKSMDVAMIIEQIKIIMLGADLEYMQSAVSQLTQQASFHDSAAVLNRNYTPLKSKLLYKQASALQNLLHFIEGLKECQKLKDDIAADHKVKAEIEKLFW